MLDGEENIGCADATSDGVLAPCEWDAFPQPGTSILASDGDAEKPAGASRDPTMPCKCAGMMG